MNYSELIAEIVTLSNRPDAAETDIPLHFRKAVLKLHHADFYYRDIEEVTLGFQSSDFIQQFDVLTAFYRYRSMSYFRKYDPTGTNPQTNLASGEAKDFFKILTPDDVLDSYSIDKTNVAYVAGSTCSIRSDDAFQFILAGWYASPDVTAAGFKSWIADVAPYAIVFEATASYFKTIGFDEQAAALRQENADQLTIVKQIGITPRGY